LPAPAPAPTPQDSQAKVHRIARLHHQVSGTDPRRPSGESVGSHRKDHIVTADRARKQEARRLARAEGIPYSDALRRLDESGTGPSPTPLTLTRLLRECVNPPSRTHCPPNCPCRDPYTDPGYHSRLLNTFIPRNTVLQLAGEYAGLIPASSDETIVIEETSSDSLTLQLGGRRYTALLSQGTIYPCCSQPGCSGENLIGELVYCATHLAEQGAAVVLKTAAHWGFDHRQLREIAGYDEGALLRAALRAGVPAERIADVLAEALNEDLLAAEEHGYGEEEAVLAGIAHDRRRLLDSAHRMRS
jgi:hypothetical protein